MSIRVVSNSPNFRVTRKYDPNKDFPILFRVQETNRAGVWFDKTPLFDADDILKWLDKNGYEPIVTSQRGRQFYDLVKKVVPARQSIPHRHIILRRYDNRGYDFGL